MPTLRESKTKSRIYEILARNADKDFVKRIYSPEDYPNIPVGENYGTHLMAYSSVGDGRAVVYPTIVHNPETGQMQRLNGRDAADYAKNNNETIMFDSEAEADWFTKNYKSVWEYPE